MINADRNSIPSREGKPPSNQCRVPGIQKSSSKSFNSHTRKRRTAFGRALAGVLSVALVVLLAFNFEFRSSGRNSDDTKHFSFYECISPCASQRSTGGTSGEGKPRAHDNP